MAAALSRGLLTAILTLAAAYTLAFFALRLLPGDAIRAQILAGGGSAAAAQARIAELGLDKPLFEQFSTSLLNTLHGDFGVSISSGRPILTIIQEQFPATLELALAALLIGMSVGLPMGAAVVWSERRAVRIVAAGFAGLTTALPTYWTGIIAIYVFSAWLRALPSAGAGGLNRLILPAAALGLALAGNIARGAAPALAAIAHMDYARTARAKGLTARVRLFDHLLRPALPTLFTICALQLGFALSGAALTESVFVRPGIGRLLVNAVLERDTPLVQGIVLLIALLYIVVNGAADWLSLLADPRLR